MISRLWAICRVTISTNTIKGAVGSTRKALLWSVCCGCPSSGCTSAVYAGTQRAEDVHTHLVNPGNGAGLWATPCNGTFPSDRDTGHTCPWRAAGEVQDTHRRLSSSAGTGSTHEPQGRSGRESRESTDTGREQQGQGTRGLASSYTGRGGQQPSLWFFSSEEKLCKFSFQCPCNLKVKSFKKSSGIFGMQAPSGDF